MPVTRWATLEVAIVGVLKRKPTIVVDRPLSVVLVIFYGSLASSPIVRILLLIIHESLSGKILAVVLGMRERIGGAVFAVLLWIDGAVETSRLLKIIKARLTVLILVHCWSARFEPVAWLLKLLLLPVLELVRILRHIRLVEGHRKR